MISARELAAITRRQQRREALRAFVAGLVLSVVAARVLWAG